MDKTYRNELHRKFLIHGLPEPLEKNGKHLQIYDNYIENTRLRLRKIRLPQTKEQTFLFQQRILVEQSKPLWKIAEIELNETEYKLFKIFEGREIRKNRYFLELERTTAEIDIYLGSLNGLITVKFLFQDETALANLKLPFPILAEVTGNSAFYGEKLVNRSFFDVQKELKGITDCG